jgi:hypothetical protein
MPATVAPFWRPSILHGARSPATGRADLAAYGYEHSLPVFRELGDRHGEAQTLGNLGVALGAVGKPDEGTAQLRQALAILEE